MAELTVRVRCASGGLYVATIPGTKHRATSTQDARFAAQAVARKQYEGAETITATLVSHDGNGVQLWRCQVEVE
ncbi:hypothetical protein PSGK_08485 [Pseudomonas solani]|uniref:hypothetical protein n=1 Tax=Pseudomonas solani TaxID=2731552 RepID=UPI0035BE110F